MSYDVADEFVGVGVGVGVGLCLCGYVYVYVGVGAGAGKLLCEGVGVGKLICAGVGVGAGADAGRLLCARDVGGVLFAGLGTAVGPLAALPVSLPLPWPCD